MASPARQPLRVLGGVPVAHPQPLPGHGWRGPGLLLVPGLCPSLLPGSLLLSGLFPCRGTGFMGRNSSRLPERRAVIVSLWVALDQRRPEQRSAAGAVLPGDRGCFSGRRWNRRLRLSPSPCLSIISPLGAAWCVGAQPGPPDSGRLGMGPRDGYGEGLVCWQAMCFPRLSGNRVP